MVARKKNLWGFLFKLLGFGVLLVTAAKPDLFLLIKSPIVSTSHISLNPLLFHPHLPLIISHLHLLQCLHLLPISMSPLCDCS